MNLAQCLRTSNTSFKSSRIVFMANRAFKRMVRRVMYVTVFFTSLFLVWRGYPFVASHLSFSVTAIVADTRLSEVAVKGCSPFCMDDKLPSPKNLNCESCFHPKSKPLIANESSCSKTWAIGPSPTFLILVLSKFSNLENRQAIRETWGNHSDDRFKVIFVFGKELDEKSNEKIKEEHDKYGDVFQDETMEQYRTVTMKLISSLKWIFDHCAHYDYLVKLDDDVYLNREKLYDHVSSLTTSTIFCHLCQKCMPLR